MVEFELPLIPSLASSSSASSSASTASPLSFGGLVVDPVPVRPDDPVPELPDRDPDDDEELLELEPEDERPPDEPADDEEELPPPAAARGASTESESASRFDCGRALRVVDKSERATKVDENLMIGAVYRSQVNGTMNLCD